MNIASVTSEINMLIIKQKLFYYNKRKPCKETKRKGTNEKEGFFIWIIWSELRGNQGNTVVFDGVWGW